jgi:mono/diheme cytochrome c family protein
MRTMNKTLSKALLIVGALALVGVVIPGVARQTQSKSEGGQQVPPLIRSVKGSDLFQAYCASCHGLDARGTGPAAFALKTKVPDLTVLTRDHRGEFPGAYVRDVILGGSIFPSHGSLEMPIWGPIFHHVERDMDWGEVRVSNLVDYLRSIQSTKPARIASGEEIYLQDCAICHGSDLKGSGVSLYPYVAPPDLTTLARRRGGKFPDDYFAKVVKNGAVIPAHGPAQMPVWGTDLTIAPWTEAELAQRIANLTNYVKAQQKK